MSDYFEMVESQLGELVGAGAHRRRPRVGRAGWMRTPGRTLITATSLLLVVVVAVVALSLRRAGAPRTPAGPIANTAAIDPSLVAGFRVLRRPVRANDRAPSRAATPAGWRLIGYDTAHLTGDPAPPAPASLGLLRAQARRVVIAAPSLQAWIIPGARGLCWFVSDGPLIMPAVCGRSLASNAITDGAWTSVGGTPRGLVGLVTDRVKAIVRRNRSGHETPVRITDGFYTTPFLGPDDELIAITASGRVALYPGR